MLNSKQAVASQLNPMLLARPSSANYKISKSAQGKSRKGTKTALKTTVQKLVSATNVPIAANLNQTDSISNQIQIGKVRCTSVRSAQRDKKIEKNQKVLFNRITNVDARFLMPNQLIVMTPT